MKHNIGFIGAGNMASAMIGGLIAKQVDPSLIYVSDMDHEKLRSLKKLYGVHIDSDNTAVAKQAEVIIFAVKPQVLITVVTALREAIQQTKPLLISIAAGVSIDKISQCVGNEVAIVRCMPNTPALVQQGISGLYANAHVNAEQHQQAEQILQAVGQTLWVTKEDDINKITAISGSGPAYLFYFMEAVQSAAEKIGLDAETAKRLTLQTAFGAAMLAKQSDLSLTQLRENVTSPGGTTEKALTYMEQKELKHIVEHAVKAALERARELS